MIHHARDGIREQDVEVALEGGAGGVLSPLGDPLERLEMVVGGIQSVAADVAHRLDDVFGVLRVPRMGSASCVVKAIHRAHQNESLALNGGRSSLQPGRDRGVDLG